MSYVRAKKFLGQHFLKDEGVAQRTAEALAPGPCKHVLEIGPGMGVLTKYLLERSDLSLQVVEIDRESVTYLEQNYPQLKGRIISGDFLEMDLAALYKEPVAVIGNFPYNISSQILFKVLDHRNLVPLAAGMFQKEVAERIAARPGNKTYGILSVLLQAWYDIEYLFTVDPHVFVPPPKVKSAVIRLTRNKVDNLGCDEDLFKRVVKAGFNQRRKTLRNSLKQFRFKPGQEDHRFLPLRAEALSVKDFIELTNAIEG